MELVRRFLACSRTEKQLFLQATVLLLSVRLGLVILPFRTLYGLIVRWSRPTTPGLRGHPSHRDQLIKALNRASHYLPGDGICLHQALVGQLLLGRNGFESHIQIGVKKGDDGEFVAHAWLESHGEVVVGGPDAHIKEYSILRNADTTLPPWSSD